MTLFRCVKLVVPFALLLVACGDDGSAPGVDGGPGVDSGSDVDGGQLVDCTGMTDGTSCGEDAICIAEECRISRCGDGFTNPMAGEECDDENEIAGDGCEPSSCTFSCAMDEQCDDTVVCNGAEMCNVAMHRCQAGSPPDGTTECDLDAGGTGVCSGTGLCVPPGCGNGTTDGTEQCDDMNLDDDDGCKADCTFTCEMDVDCTDGDACNGDEVCNTTTHVCEDPPATLDCDDADVCTADSCDMAMGCLNDVIDVDDDGFSPGTCASGGPAGGDCDDANNTVYPGAMELCDGIDNDCNMMIDDGPQPDITCYRDSDSDGYGNETMTMTDCSCPSGYVPRHPSGEFDCRDNFTDVNPGQTAFFTSGYCPGPFLCLPAARSFDYDCDGVATQQYTVTGRTTGGCGAVLGSLCGGSGWTGRGAPACGASAEFVSCAFTRIGMFFVCQGSLTTRQQGCR